MKLNPDCMRSILLAVENACDIDNCFDLEKNFELIDGGFSLDEIKYHVRQCELAGLFYEYNSNLDETITIADLSPAGHEFLANIREETIWNNVKSVSAKVGSKSLSGIIQIASSVVTQLIKAQLGLL